MADLHTGVGTAPAALGLPRWNQAKTEAATTIFPPNKDIIKGNAAHQALGHPFVRPTPHKYKKKL